MTIPPISGIVAASSITPAAGSTAAAPIGGDIGNSIKSALEAASEAEFEFAAGASSREGSAPARRPWLDVRAHRRHRSIDLDPGLATVGMRLLRRMMIAAVELAMPALAALFLVEVVLGIASRFAPQANVFLIGLPAKVVAALASVGAVVLLMLETMDGVLGIMRDTFRHAVGGLGG